MNDFLQSLRNGQAEKPKTPKTRKNSDNSYHYTSAPRFPSYGGGYSNSRNQQMRRPPISQQPGNQAPMMDDVTVTSMLAEAIEGLSRHIETLAKNQDYMVAVQERTADMLERQAIAIERIVDHLNIAPLQETAPSKEHTSQQPFEHHYVTSPSQNIDPEPEKAFVEPEIVVAKPIKPIKPAKSVIRRRKKIVAAKAPETTLTDSKLLGRDVIMDIIQNMRKEGATYDQVASRLIELGQPTFSGRGEWHAQTIHRLCSKK
ncbi:MAG: hypothetical protein ABIJ59_17040 [Pseudomonadota bacterium]